MEQLQSIEDGRAGRAELRAQLRATDPRPEHWLKRANRLLEERLEANRIANGWPKVVSGSAYVPEPPQTRQDEPTGVYHPAVGQRPVEAPQPSQEPAIYDRPEYRDAAI